MAAALVVAVLGTSYWLLPRPAAEPEAVPSEVVVLESSQVSLAGGRYLKVGVALQLIEEYEGT